MLLTVFTEIPDRRRKQGQRYDLAHVLLFSVLAILCGAKSYREIHTFMEERFFWLKKNFDIKKWKKAPAYTAIRYIIQGVDPEEMEKAFRKYSLELSAISEGGFQFINLDGKTARGSFDHFNDQKAIQVFSAFLSGQDIILAHEEIPNQKTNEIPVAQQMIKELGLENSVFTSDALHCQKKLSKL